MKRLILTGMTQKFLKSEERFTEFLADDNKLAKRNNY